MKKIALLLLIFAASIYSQTYNYRFSIGKFNSASAFYISQSGFLYITDTGTDEVYKYDTLGTLLNEAGGYGWQENNFDNPVDVYANTLHVYVTDRNNHRILRYDKDLNYISQLSTRELGTPEQQFGYPLSCAVSTQGDMYILDSENSRVVKFDMFGSYQQNFGGYDAGEFMLRSPLKLAVSPGGLVYVLEKKRLVIFDQYGNGISIIKLEDKITGINITFNDLALSSKDKIYNTLLTSLDRKANPVSFSGFEKSFTILSTLIYNSKLFILTSNAVLVFEKPDEQ